MSKQDRDKPNAETTPVHGRPTGTPMSDPEWDSIQRMMREIARHPTRPKDFAKANVPVTDGHVNAAHAVGPITLQDGIETPPPQARVIIEDAVLPTQVRPGGLAGIALALRKRGPFMTVLGASVIGTLLGLALFKMVYSGHNGPTGQGAQDNVASSVGSLSSAAPGSAVRNTALPQVQTAEPPLPRSTASMAQVPAVPTSASPGTAASQGHEVAAPPGAPSSRSPAMGAATTQAQPRSVVPTPNRTTGVSQRTTAGAAPGQEVAPAPTPLPSPAPTQENPAIEAPAAPEASGPPRFPKIRF